jgi:hypothetical protein
MQKLTYFLLLLLLTIPILPQDGGTPLYPGNTNLRFKGKIGSTYALEAFTYLGIKYGSDTSGFVAGTGPTPAAFDARFIPSNHTFELRGVTDPPNYIGVKDHTIRLLVPSNYTSVELDYSLPNFICVEVRETSTGNPLVVLQGSGLWQVPGTFTQKDFYLKVFYNLKNLAKPTNLQPANLCLFNPVQLSWTNPNTAYVGNCYPVIQKVEWQRMLLLII